MPGPGAATVTVVIPTKDRWELLRHTLASVLDQRDVDIRVVVVDDGSEAAPDADTAELLADARLEVVRHPRALGVAAARNAGLARATTPWVAFTDDDDVWAPDKLSEQLAALAALPDTRWSCVGVVEVDASMRPIAWEPPVASGDVADRLLAANVVPGGGSGVLVATDTVRAAGGFDEALRNLADYELYIRLGLAAPLAAVARPLLAYRVHRGGLSRQLDDVEDEYAYVLAKHAATRSARGVDPVAHVHFWAADRLERSGRRWRAARAYARSAREVAVVPALKRVAMLCIPGMVDVRDRRRSRVRPDRWRDEDLSWLDQSRSARGGSTPQV
jgi:glycosyltransferase involved in cell wall biosynthesis